VPALATLCRQTAATAGSHDEARDGWLAWISPPYQPYAPALAACGIDVERVLVVRAESALWAMEQALKSGACSAVLGWAAACGLQALRRLQLAAEQSRCLAVLFRRAGDASFAPRCCELVCGRGIKVRLKSRSPGAAAHPGTR
jgi:hypothetical protein